MPVAPIAQYVYFLSAQAPLGLNYCIAICEIPPISEYIYKKEESPCYKANPQSNLPLPPPFLHPSLSFPSLLPMDTSSSSSVLLKSNPLPSPPSTAATSAIISAGRAGLLFRRRHRSRKTERPWHRVHIGHCALADTERAAWCRDIGWCIAVAFCGR